MPRKSDGLTPRQRQSRQLMRAREALKKRKALLQKLYIVGGSILCVMMIGGGVWGWKSGALRRLETATLDFGYGLTAKAGFTVQGLYLEGRNRTSLQDIEKALDVKKGDPILRVSVDEMRDRLEKIESIRLAAVERSLPGTLYVRIIERKPVAIWQHQGKLALVDDKGVVMSDLDIAPYRQLPLIIGDDAPTHASEILELLSSQPELVKRFAAAIHVGERRWNIRLNGSHGKFIEVKLPENDPAHAWKKLAELEDKEQVLDRDVSVIDLRLRGKMFIKLVPESLPASPAGAQET